MSYSAQQTKASGTNFYMAFIMLPAEKRMALDAVYAFCRYTDDIVDEEPDPAKAADDLEAWRKEFAACCAGKPQHPITQDLYRFGFKNFQLPHEHFEAIIDGCEMDLRQSRYETFSDLTLYCERVASAVGLLCIEIFGYEHPDTRLYAYELGLALQLTNILRDIPKDAQRGRIYLPLEDLKRFGVTEEEILQQRPGGNFVELMKFEGGRAEEKYRAAQEIGRRIWTPNLYPAEVMGQIYHRILRRMTKTNYDVFAVRPRVSKIAKLHVALSLYLRTVVLGRMPWPNVASS